MELLCLPNEIILKIFGYLSFPDVLPSISACKQLFLLLTRDDIWYPIAKEYFGIKLLYKRNLSWHSYVTDKMKVLNFFLKISQSDYLNPRKKKTNIIKWLKQNIKTNSIQVRGNNTSIC
jgi:hypothetical protein